MIVVIVEKGIVIGVYCDYPDIEKATVVDIDAIRIDESQVVNEIRVESIGECRKQIASNVKKHILSKDVFNRVFREEY